MVPDNRNMNLSIFFFLLTQTCYFPCNCFFPENGSSITPATKSSPPLTKCEQCASKLIGITSKRSPSTPSTIATTAPHRSEPHNYNSSTHKFPRPTTHCNKAWIKTGARRACNIHKFSIITSIWSRCVCHEKTIPLLRSRCLAFPRTPHEESRRRREEVLLLLRKVQSMVERHERRRHRHHRPHGRRRGSSSIIIGRRRVDEIEREGHRHLLRCRIIDR